jgi:non-homologous end joining protein Ku
MTADFNPDKYANERRKKIMTLLKKKLKQQAAVEAPAIEGKEGEEPVDLIAALEESMRKLKKDRQ